MEPALVTLPDVSSFDQWVDGIRHRSDAAFRAVYESMANDLASFALGFLHDRKAAEDAVQQAFLELVKAADTITGDGRSLRAWLYRSVRYSCLDELRRRKRKPVHLGAHEDDHPPILVDPLPDHLAPELEMALNQLSDRQRNPRPVATRCRVVGRRDRSRHGNVQNSGICSIGSCREASAFAPRSSPPPPH